MLRGANDTNNCKCKKQTRTTNRRQLHYLLADDFKDHWRINGLEEEEDD